MLHGIPHDQIDNVWGKVAPILQRAVDKSQHDYAIQDIYAALKQRDMQLWVWVENDAIEACCITQIISYPRRRICQMPFIAGNKMKNWLSTEETIVAWAKERGCSQFEGFARDGWLRVLKNWSKVWNTIRRDI